MSAWAIPVLLLALALFGMLVFAFVAGVSYAKRHQPPPPTKPPAHSLLPGGVPWDGRASTTQGPRDGGEW